MSKDSAEQAREKSSLQAQKNTDLFKGEVRPAKVIGQIAA